MYFEKFIKGTPLGKSFPRNNANVHPQLKNTLSPPWLHIADSFYFASLLHSADGF